MLRSPIATISVHPAVLKGYQEMLTEYAGCGYRSGQAMEMLAERDGKIERMDAFVE